MKTASESEIEVFKKSYCSNERNREQIFANYIVSVELFVELFPGQQVYSYATGNRKIKDSFIMFKVYDSKSDICYFPIFSETIGRQMLKSKNIKLPPKICVFSNPQKNDTEENNSLSSSNTLVKDRSNYLVRVLIIFVYSIRTYNQSNPLPMNGPLKNIYDKMTSDPSLSVKPTEIKAINTILKAFLSYTKFNHLNEYIDFIKKQYPHKKIKNVNFNLLRKLFQDNYSFDSLSF